MPVERLFADLGHIDTPQQKGRRTGILRARGQRKSPTDNPQPGLVLISEDLGGADLAFLLRGLYHGRGLELAKWGGANLPSGQAVTPELLKALERILVRARLARRLPVKGARAELLATHRQALEVLRGAFWPQAVNHARE